ncbi:MAG: isopenicillin N synthase family oxygenase [Betaproteobacteria bacterium]|nr:isopenicillin N synthase family oxygenase [Betaproteobacteria bacterium]
MAASIPTLDIGILGASGPAGALELLAQGIRDASESAGFFYVVNHGVPAHVVEDAFAANRRFHAWPQERKDALRQNRWHRGYMGYGDAKLASSARFAAAQRPNRMESFILRHEVAPEHPDALAGKPLQGPNQWPDDPWIAGALRRYDAALSDLGMRLLPALSVAAGEAPGFFAPFFRPPATALRLIHYPPSPPDRPEDLYGSHPHTDYGFLTVLAQDDVGGLEVQAHDGRWIPAPSVADTFVINIGDAFGRWTNDAFRSTPHRVINPSQERDRYSVAYFFDPNLDARIECLERFRRDAPAKYAPVRFGEYFAGRLDANYARYEGPPAAR